MTVSQKALCSFLLSALLCAGIAALALTGVFNNYNGIVSVSTQIVMLVAVFLTLFLIIFFCFNLRRDPVKKSAEIETAEEISAGFMSAEAVQVEVVTGLSGGFFMFRQPFTFIPSNPELLQGAENQETGISGEVVYEQNGIHYISSNVFADNKDREEFDNNFANLVESVVDNKEFELT